MIAPPEPGAAYVLTLPRAEARRLVTWVGVISAFFVVTTGLHPLIGGQVSGEVAGLVARNLTLTSERAVPVFWSSLVLGLGALACLGCWLATRQRGGTGFDRAGWLILATGLTALSLDESASLHERIDRLALPDLSFGLAIGWVASLGLPMLLATAVMAVFALRLARYDRRVALLLGAGAVLFMTVPVQEVLEGRLWAWGPRPAWASALEEGAELLGAIALLAAALRFLSGRDEPSAPGAGPCPLVVTETALVRIVTAILGISVLVAVGVAAIAPGSLDHPIRFVGPLPWMAGTAALLTAAAAYLRSRVADRGPARERTGVHIVMVVAIAWAFDQGAGLVLTEQLWGGSPRAALAAHIAIAAATLAAVLAAAARLGNRPLRLRVVAWGAGLALAALLAHPVATATAVIVAQGVLAPFLVRQPKAAVPDAKTPPQSGDGGGVVGIEPEASASLGVRTIS